MLGNSAIVVVAVRTRPRTIPLAKITMRKSTRGFPLSFPLHDEYGAPLGGHLGPLGHRSSAIIIMNSMGVSSFLVGTVYIQ